jgi:hypothetical protein
MVYTLLYLTLPRFTLCTTRFKVKHFYVLSQKGGPGQRSRYNDSLQAGRTGDRIAVGGGIFPAVRTDPEATQPPVKCAPALFPGVKEAGVWY